MRLVLAFMFVGVTAVATAGDDIATLAYHDIVLKKSADPYVLTVKEFQGQMDYLARHGFHPVSVKQLDDARQRRARLPDKPVLLTFDDGLLSFYEHVYPILEKYNYPAVVNVVTAWTDGRTRPDEPYLKFMTWDQLRALKRSPLIEILAHTDNLHRSLPGNPQGNRLAAGVTRTYDAAKKTYETEHEFRRRVAADLATASQRLKTELGAAPRGIAWPYGHYDGVLLEEAARLGMVYHLTLDAEPTRLETLPRINRTTFYKYRSLSDLTDALTHKVYYRDQIRFIDLDLQVFVGRSVAEVEQLLSALIDRVDLLRVNAIVLSPFTPDRERAFFATERFPVEADVLSRVIHQIVRRVGIWRVYVKWPVEFMALEYATLRTDFARLNWFHGVVLTGRPTAADVTMARAAFGHHQPSFTLGVTAGSEASEADFVLVDVDPEHDAAAIERDARVALAAHPRVLFSIRATASHAERLLTRAMQALRAAGAAHYGYRGDDFTDNTPDARKIVQALTEHTVVRLRR